MNTSWINWACSILPEDAEHVALEELPFIPSPYTPDLPYMLWSDNPDPGSGLVRAFGETTTINSGARRRYRIWCRQNVDYALARIHLSLEAAQEKGPAALAKVEERWRRRLRASLRLSTAHILVPSLPVPDEALEIEDRWTVLIDAFLATARGYDPYRLLARLRGPGCHKSIITQIERPGLAPSMPNMHIDFEYDTNVTIVNARGVQNPSRDQARELMRDMMPRLHRRLNKQPSPAYILDSVLLGTYHENALRFFISTITSGQSDAAFPDISTSHALSAGALVPVYRRWKRRRADDLFCSVNELFLPGELQAWQESVEAYQEFIASLPPHWLCRPRTYWNRRADGALLRWTNAYERDDSLEPPTTRSEIADDFEAIYEEQGGKCALCGVLMTMLCRGHRHGHSAAPAVHEEASEEGHAEGGARVRGSHGADDGDDGDDGESDDDLAAMVEGLDEVDDDAAATGRADASYPGDFFIGSVFNTLYQRLPWAPEPHNASPDRKEAGEGYNRPNVHMVCLMCNYIKWLYPLPLARLIIYHLASSWRKQDLEKIAKPSAKGSTTRTLDASPSDLPAPPEPSDHELDMIRKLAERRLAQLRWSAESRGLDFDLEVDDVIALFLSRRVGEGLFLGHDGAILPMPLASFDRIDNDRGYVNGNIRLILLAFNVGRRRSNHDESTISWHQGVDYEFVCQKAREPEVAREVLPHSEWLKSPDIDGLLLDDDDGAWSASDDSDYQREDDEDDVADAFESMPPLSSLGPGDLRRGPAPALPDFFIPREAHRIVERLVGNGPLDSVLTSWVAADGNCQFHAVAASAPPRADGTLWTAETLRAEVVRLLHQSVWRQRIEPYLDPRDGRYEDWRERMAHNEWGNEHTLIVMREIIGVPIVYVTDSQRIVPGTDRVEFTRSMGWTRDSDRQNYAGEKCVGVWHDNRSPQHYYTMYK